MYTYNEHDVHMHLHFSLLRFGDLYGGRAALVLAFMSASLSYLLLGAAFSIPMLFLSRLPSLCMHAMQGTSMRAGSLICVYRVKPN